MKASTTCKLLAGRDESELKDTPWFKRCPRESHFDRIEFEGACMAEEAFHNRRSSSTLQHSSQWLASLTATDCPEGSPSYNHRPYMA